jgi:hypothetical protein
MEKTKTRDPIPEFHTLEDIAEFWDAHSTADYDDLTREVHFEITISEEADAVQRIVLLPELSRIIQNLAHSQGVSAETLVNVWLTEKVLQLS